MDIDWDDAPEGATHNDCNAVTPWLRLSRHKQEFYLRGRWLAFGEEYPVDIDFEKLTSRPLDTRTDDQKAIDDIKGNISLRARDGADIVSEEVLEAIKAGKIHNVKWTGK